MVYVLSPSNEISTLPSSKPILARYFCNVFSAVFVNRLPPAFLKRLEDSNTTAGLSYVQSPFKLEFSTLAVPIRFWNIDPKTLPFSSVSVGWVSVPLLPPNTFFNKLPNCADAVVVNNRPQQTTIHFKLNFFILLYFIGFHLTTILTALSSVRRMYMPGLRLSISSRERASSTPCRE